MSLLIVSKVISKRLYYRNSITKLQETIMTEKSIHDLNKNTNYYYREEQTHSHKSKSSVPTCTVLLLLPRCVLIGPPSILLLSGHGSALKWRTRWRWLNMVA